MFLFISRLPERVPSSLCSQDQGWNAVNTNTARSVTIIAERERRQFTQSTDHLKMLSTYNKLPIFQQHKHTTHSTTRSMEPPRCWFGGSDDDNDDGACFIALRGGGGGGRGQCCEDNASGMGTTGGGGGTKPCCCCCAIVVAVAANR